MKPSTGSVFVAGALVVVIVAVVAGLLALGSPADERARRIDHRRVTDLQGIMAAANLYWTRHDRLPSSLDDLIAEPGVTISVTDPSGSEPYGFRPLDSLRYEVCATFEGESDQISRDPTRDLWAHGSGRQCFQLEAEDITDDGG
jgi:hypothetical protein